MEDMTYRGMRIEPTLSASRELMEHDKGLYDVLKILKNGYDCSPSKRKGNLIEKGLRRGNKESRVVLAETEITYPDKSRESVFRIIHFGKIAYKKERRKEQ